jgi:hypothetical protein
MARTKTIKVGTVIPVDVTRERIDQSIPCDKGNCMLTLAGIETLESRFGKQDYNVKSTNHGMTFDINGYRILTVFNHDTGHRIYQYDETFKRTRNMAKARASVKPFRAKLMVESCQKKPVYPPMSEATKAILRQKATGRKNNRKPTGLRRVNRRQLSE